MTYPKNINSSHSLCDTFTGFVGETSRKFFSTAGSFLSRAVVPHNGSKERSRERSRTELFKSKTDADPVIGKRGSEKPIRASRSMPLVCGTPLINLFRVCTSPDTLESEEQEIFEETLSEKNKIFFTSLVEGRDKVKAVTLRGLNETAKSEEVRGLFKKDSGTDIYITNPNNDEVAYKIYYNHHENLSTLEVSPGKDLILVLSELKKHIIDCKRWSLTAASKAPKDYSPIWSKLNKAERGHVTPLGNFFSQLSEEQVREINSDAASLDIEKVRQKFSNKLKTIVKLSKKNSPIPGNAGKIKKLRSRYQFKYQLLGFISWHFTNSNLPESQKNQIVVSLAIATCSCEKRFAEALSEAYQQITSHVFMPNTPPIEHFFDEWTEGFKNAAMDKSLSESPINHTGNIRYGVVELLKKKEGILVTKDLNLLPALSSTDNNYYTIEIIATSARFLKYFNPRDYAQHCCDSLNSLLKESKGSELECHILCNLITQLREYAAQQLEKSVDAQTIGLLDEFLIYNNLITMDSMDTFNTVTLEGMYILLQLQGKIASTENMELDQSTVPHKVMSR